MRVLERFPHKPIIQLPQTIHFSDEASLKAMASIIKAQSDFTLFVRDTCSFEFARSRFECEVVLAPDMAFAMPPITRNPAHLDYLCLLRSDKEAVANHEYINDVIGQSGKSIEICDWIGQPRDLTARLDAKINGLTRRIPAVTAPLRPMTMRLRQHYAMRRLIYGIRLLSQGAIVVTDRLHAHILCCLLDIPHFVFDSFGGKISAFHRTWTRDESNTRFIETLADFGSKWNKVF